MRGQDRKHIPEELLWLVELAHPFGSGLHRDQSKKRNEGSSKIDSAQKLKHEGSISRLVLPRRWNVT